MLFPNPLCWAIWANNGGPAVPLRMRRAWKASPDSLPNNALSGATTARMTTAQAMNRRMKGTKEYATAARICSGTNTTTAWINRGCNGRPNTSSNKLPPCYGARRARLRGSVRWRGQGYAVRPPLFHTHQGETGSLAWIQKPAVGLHLVVKAGAH